MANTTIARTRCPYCNQVFEGNAYGGDYAEHVRLELRRAYDGLHTQYMDYQRGKDIINKGDSRMECHYEDIPLASVQPTSNCRAAWISINGRVHHGCKLGYLHGLACICRCGAERFTA